MVTSPLTGTSEVALLRRLDCRDLVARWREAFNIDIDPELRGHAELHLYRCTRTGLEFFEPADVAGGSEFYARLQRFNWYYLPRKWEHDRALTDLARCRRVIEIGCGSGAFLARLHAAHGADVTGIELNAAAATAARASGLTVETVDLYDFAPRHLGEFDAVCAFQVLEHVPDSARFLAALVSLLRPGGRLVLAVPNQDSFLRHVRYPLLDQPPHHMTHWTPHTLRALTQLWPLRLHGMLCEPLAPYHVDWFLHVQVARLRRPLVHRVAGRLASALLRPLLQRVGPARRCIRGHTVYACFEKLAVAQ